MVSPHTDNIRFDLQIIGSIIPEGSRILDLGCGSGDLLAWLTEQKGVKGTGIEQNKEKAAHCIGRGLSVLQGDLNDEVDDYPDEAFDYVILSQTLQQVFEPARLLYSLARIGKKVIVSFPNFSHYAHRMQLFFKGTAPRSPELPYFWYDTPNIRVITFKDFRQFSKDVGYHIIQEIAINTNASRNKGQVIKYLSNLRATYGIYVIEKIRNN